MTRKNNWLNALKKLVLFSAIFHLLLLTLHAIIKMDLTRLNYFKILELNLFFPELVSYNFLSLLVVIGVYLIIYFVSARKTN